MKRLLFALWALSALTTAYADNLVINEVMASNAGVAMSPATNFDSWIELYNPNTTWLGSNDIKSNQAPFKLDCDGGAIYLSDKNGQLITSVNYPQALSRTAWARTTDGQEGWNWTANATPGATNATAVFASERLDAPVVSTGSQLINSSISFHVDIPEGTTLMYTTDCSVPTSTVATGSCKKSTTGNFTVSQTTNYVFRLFKDGYLPSVPVTRSFIKTTHNYTIPVISVVGDERYFTDNTWGIDVRGTNGITGNGSDDQLEPAMGPSCQLQLHQSDGGHALQSGCQHRRIRRLDTNSRSPFHEAQIQQGV